MRTCLFQRRRALCAEFRCDVVEVRRLRRGHHRRRPSPNPFVQPFNGDQPEHMQIRPTRWRIRGPQDYLDDLEDPPEDEDYDVLSDA